MRWHRTDPVQAVGALIAIGPGSVDRLADAMAQKSGMFGSVLVEHGADWVALFAAPVEDAGDDVGGVLPRLVDVTHLYEMARGWWLPVGWGLAAPEHVRGALLDAMADHHRIAPPAIVFPVPTDIARRTCI